MNNSSWCAQSLSGEVDQILRTLSGLPGRETMKVQTRHYPRLGAAENGSGFEECVWSFDAHADLPPLPIPANVDDVIVTWMGVMQSALKSQDEFRRAVFEAMAELVPGMHWEYRVFTRTKTPDEDTTVIEVFRAPKPPGETMAD